jgi:hypothetical protein
MRLSGPRSRPTTSQKNLVAPEIEPETSASLARNSDHWTTEAVHIFTTGSNKCLTAQQFETLTIYVRVQHANS